MTTMAGMAATGITMTTDPDLTGARLQRLLTWLSPAFPVGAFSYSHGLEAAVEAGLVEDREDLCSWVAAIVESGAGRIDAALFLAAHAAVTESDDDAMAWAVERGDAMRSTSEIGVETTGQGGAFLAAVERHWPAPGIARLRAVVERDDRDVCYPVAVGVAAAAHGLSVRPALEAYLHAFAANIVSAGVRLIPLGQSDGLHVLALLEPVIVGATSAALDRSTDDLGSAAVMVDWASSIHETQYTRLFRS